MNPNQDVPITPTPEKGIEIEIEIDPGSKPDEINLPSKKIQKTEEN